MKTILWKGERVATNTELYALIESKQEDKAKKHAKALHAKFMETWPEGKEDLLNFKIGVPKDDL